MSSTRRIFGFMISLLGGLILWAPRVYSFVPVENPPMTLIQTLDADADFSHFVGQKGGRGWEVNYKKHKPGYALKNLKDPLLLEPGTYRVTFSLRRGHYPSKGLLHKAYGIFRIELWDVTADELIVGRELQRLDFSSPNTYEKKWLEFSMEGREGHWIEPAVYWLGLANGEVDTVEIHQFPEVSLLDLKKKADQLEERLIQNHLENGFVVPRDAEGQPSEIGDALTYTGYLLAAWVWKYAVTKDPMTYQSIENTIQLFHNAIKGTQDHPLIVRYIDENGNPFPKGPSKDVYNSFFFGYSTAYPFIKNKALKKQMVKDLTILTDRFLQDNLTVKSSNGELVTLSPFFTEHEIRHGIKKLFNDRDDYRKIMKELKSAKKYYPFGEYWPGMKKVIKAMQKKDANALFNLVVPTLNGLTLVLEKGRDLLREQYRSDLFPKRFRNQEYPGKKLEMLLTELLRKLPPDKKGGRFDHVSELKVLASNALISLHMVKTAEVWTRQPQFEDYYRNNLFTQDALLQTAVHFYGMEENIIRLTSGNPSADRLRKGVLSALALMNLIKLETNPFIRAQYVSILERWWESYRHDDNPLAAAIFLAAQMGGPEMDEKKSKANPSVLGLIYRGLDLYPLEPQGLGDSYWDKNGKAIGEILGGGVSENYAREPIPISHRPRDSFLWQRNSRQLRGDSLKNYPGTDYLFLYWFCRYHGLIPEFPPEPSVQK